MKKTEDMLQRLFRTASRATPGPADPPLGLESRVIASWQSHAARESFDPLSVVRSALLAALALVCVVGALEYKTFADNADPATLVTNSAFLAALNP